DAGGELLLTAAADEPGNEASARDHVDHRELLGEPYRIVGERQRIAQQDDLHTPGGGGEDGREDVALGLHAEGCVVVLVQHDAVEADALGQPVVLEVLVVETAPGGRIEVAVGEHERGGPELPTLRLGVCRHGLLGEVHEMHQASPWLAKSMTSRASSSGFS